MKKPAVDFIEGLCPAIAIEQKVNTHNPRSTVATSTEIYDYLKLLYSRVGKTISPISGREVKRDTPQDVFNFCNTLNEGELILVLSPIKDEEPDLLSIIQKKGFSRIYSNHEIFKVDDLIENNTEIDLNQSFIVIDRIKIDKESDDFSSRLYDSIETAFWESNGDCVIINHKSQASLKVSNIA
jgi:excinuclease ABC subunit A